MKQQVLVKTISAYPGDKNVKVVINDEEVDFKISVEKDLIKLVADISKKETKTVKTTKSKKENGEG